MKLSFIIPAYNASKTIERTLESIRNLTLDKKDYEIIVVDDASTDETVPIIEDWKLENRDCKLELLQQPENHRQGAARNRGLKAAKGEYVMFVDADDIAESGVPEALMTMEKIGADVLFCDYLWQYSDTNIEHRYMDKPEGFMTTGKDFAEECYDTITHSCPICYIWRREYLLTKGVLFLENRRIEDFDWIEQNVYNADMVGYSKHVIYRVLTYQNTSSTTHTVNPEVSADWAHAGYRRLKFCDTIREESPKFAEKLEFQSRCFVSNILKIRNLTKFSPRGIIQLKKRLGDEARAYLIAKGGWNRETRMCLKYIDIMAVLDCVMWPMAVVGRKIVRITR